MIPERIELKTTSRVLELHYAGEAPYQLDFEFLRVLSPSAEVQGHGKPVLQFGKKGVLVKAVEPAGNYALKLVFDDGHDSGLYSWDYLRKLCQNKNTLWDDYLKQLADNGLSRST